MSSGLDNSPANVIRASTWSRITSTITQWRNWKLAVKLTAVGLVPVIFSLALGVLQIRGQIRQADEYSRLGAVVGAAGLVRSAVAELQEERTRAAEFLARGPSLRPMVQERFASTDKALVQSASALRDQHGSALVVLLARDEVDRQLAQIPLLRRQVMGLNMDPGVAVNSYSEIVGALLTLDRALLGQISAPELSSTATTSHELAKISEEVRLQHALVLVGLHRGLFPPTALGELRDSETRRVGALKEFRSAATPRQRMDYDRLYLKSEIPGRDASLQTAMTVRVRGEDDESSSAPAIPAHVWDEQSKTSLTELGSLQSGLDDQLRRKASALRDTASNMAGLESVILLSALLIAGAIAVVIARQLLGSLEGLRRSAFNAATRYLPQAVADIRAGHGPRTTIDRVPVHTTEELGQVARAFETVQTQAVNLASEQAELRKSYRDSFVNVSRRSQTLLERQLRLFEQLERDEEDPDQLATLFQLDHLATRMRRNNENLMVLSGTDPARRFTQAATPADLVRAAVSEIEHYPRVIVQPLPDSRIVGYAASDLVRLLAELLDNAANFSAPQTNVTVSGHRRGDGSVGIDIVDRGIGMSDAELAAANQRLATDREIELSTSRRMGLFVVGRLATRHGITVRLHAGPNNTGVRATVSVRRELLLDAVPVQMGARTNGAHVPVADPVEDTIVEEFDWSAAEQDITNHQPPTRNGFHLLDDAAPKAAERPDAPEHDLFSPPQDDDGERSAPARHNGAPVRTPIFDDLASAWFRVSQAGEEGFGPFFGGGVRWRARPGDARKGTFLSDVEERFPSSQSNPAPTPTTPHQNGTPQPPTQDPNAARDTAATWTFSSDQARRRAEEVSTAEPEDYTSVGLPMRVPRAHLIAGSAGDDGSDTASRPQRDPNVARNRLASFQQGLQRGRHRNGTQADSAEPDESGPVTDWVHDAETNGSPQAESAADSEPVDYTAAGLPRRNPRAQLVPDTANEPANEVQQRDADLVRGRLNSFQRGVREGKHCLREPADEPAEDHS